VLLLQLLQSTWRLVVGWNRLLNRLLAMLPIIDQMVSHVNTLLVLTVSSLYGCRRTTFLVTHDHGLICCLLRRVAGIERAVWMLGVVIL